MKYTNKSFIKKAKKLFKSNFCYSKTNYEFWRKKVIIICPVHGELSITPFNHFGSFTGCPNCDKILKKDRFDQLWTNNLFKKRIKNLNPHLKLSKCKFKTLYEPVKYDCKIHGEKRKRPYDLLRFNGCNSCSTITRNKLSEKELIRRIKLNGNSLKYDYSKVDFSKNIRQLNIIICKIHGDFPMRLQNHLDNKQGCPKCALEFNRNNSVGWRKNNWLKASRISKNYTGFKLYLILLVDPITKESFIKIGRTFTSIKRRLKKVGSYEYKILDFINSEDHEFIYNLEVLFKKEFIENKYIPLSKFGGMYECFNLKQKKQMLKFFKDNKKNNS